MDFLSRYIVNCALAGAFGLVSLPAFGVLDSPNYSWRLTSDGQAYKVYDPQGPHLSNNFTPGSSFVDNSAGGVIENVAPGPLTIDGATGEILNGASLSRGLSVGDLIDGVSGLLKVDNPVGLALLTGSLLAPLVIEAYDKSPSGSSAPSTTYYCGSSSYSSSQSIVPDGTPSCGSYSACDLSGGCFVTGTCSTTGEYYMYAGPSCANGDTPTLGPAPVSQSVADTWAQAHPNQFNTYLSPLLTPADQTSLANDLANSNAPLSTPVPYGYNIPSTDATVTGSPTTTTSTDPSTGNTTNTTSTPSYKFSTPTPPNGVQVQKSVTTVTQTCTSAGSCTVTNTTTNTSPATQPKLGSFTSPTLSAPTTSAIAPTPYALNLNMPSQSSAVCPSPLAYNAFGTAFTIPLSPLCTLAIDVRPYVESLGAVGAGIVIFR